MVSYEDVQEAVGRRARVGEKRSKPSLEDVCKALKQVGITHKEKGGGVDRSGEVCGC